MSVYIRNIQIVQIKTREDSLLGNCGANTQSGIGLLKLLNSYEIFRFLSTDKLHIGMTLIEGEKY